MTDRYDIQAVIFDVGGVLDLPGDLVAERAVRLQLAKGLNLTEEEMWSLFYRGDHWKLARIGRITGREFWNRNLTPFGITDPAEQVLFTERLFAHKEVTPAMRALLEELAGRTRLAIISNADDVLEEILEERYKISHFFGVIINSARVGYAKPDPEIFRIALERLNLRPEQTVFTDDQGHNVEAAAALGIHAHLFASVADFRAFLVERGVLPGN
jgi:putative hydrolase of the HAD superfamily